MTAQVYNQENEKRQNNQTPISPEPLKVSWISPQPLFNIHWYGDLVASQAKSWVRNNSEASFSAFILVFSFSTSHFLFFLLKPI